MGQEPAFDSDGYSMTDGERNQLLVLSDSPVGEGDNVDRLHMDRTARQLARLVVSSRSSTPFALAVDAAWGMGKSSLLRQLQVALADQPGVSSVWFNAWTGGPASALEGMIKSVLLSFDRSVIRRTVRSLARRTQLVGSLRLLSMLVATFFGLGRVVADIWQVLSTDAKSRNEIKPVVADAVRTWLARSEGSRLLVVFVDDLDRCGPERIVEVCEAIKLYLDVQGMVFVLACDQTVLWRAVRESAGVERAAGAVEYLEKIIQLNYRIPAPSETRAAALIESYLIRSGTGGFFDTDMRNLVIERTGRNPRRIKRLINSFVLEYELTPDWAEVGAENLMKVIMLQHFYPEFYRDLVDPRVDDVIVDFLSYLEFRKSVRQGGHRNVAAWRRLFVTKGIKPPPLEVPEEDLAGLLAELEAVLPVSFPELATDRDFVALAGSLSVPIRSDRLRRLLRKPLTPIVSEPFAEVGGLAREAVRGLVILWIDDDSPKGDSLLFQELTRFGAEVTDVPDRDLAVRELRRRRPDVLLSDVTRFGDDEAGFTDLEYFRHEGLYDGPVIFYTGGVTPTKLRRATDLGVAAITDNPAEVLRTLVSLATGATA